jgi:hypothetical protein
VAVESNPTGVDQVWRGGLAHAASLRHEPRAQPSAQVLDALARALQLDGYATAHLHRLAGPPLPRRRRSPRPEKAPASILRLIASWSHTPAHVHGRYMDVLAANPLATVVVPYHAPGHNLVRAAFLDPRVRDMHGDWEFVGESTVAGLRALVGPTSMTLA